MSILSRRSFLTRGSLVVGGAGLAASIPGLPSLLTAAESDAPAVESAVTDEEVVAADTSGPLVAHLQDLRSGRISLFVGEREISVTNPGLAAQLYRSTR